MSTVHGPVSDLKMVRRLLVVMACLLSMVSCSELTVRLSGGKYTEAGYVEVWREGRWGAMCVSTAAAWSSSTADVVCRHLGYSGSLQHHLGVTSYAAVPPGVLPVTDELSCTPGEGLGSLSQCQVSFSPGCPSTNILSVICKPESRSACGPQSTAMLGHCYRIFQEEKTFPEAQAVCQKISANLVEISDQRENLLVSSMIQKTTNYPDLSRFWTGGVVSEIANAKFMIWHGSQNKIEFDNQIDKNKATEKTHGISFETNKEGQYPAWKTVDFDVKLPFICQYPPNKIGCLEDGDQTGLKYNGHASHDKDGDECAAWNSASDGEYPWTDNYCRNPDNGEGPYCLLPSGEPSGCDIPLCSNQDQRIISYPNLCREGSPGSVNVCHKEEYRCSSGKCISSDYVCDGVPDCQEGDDEVGCRVLSSLFYTLGGYKLEGQLKVGASESVRASLEDCAKLCLYQKLNGTGCCDSFSHRRAKDGKDDRCTLGSVYVTNSLNKSFDSLVEKKSWNYYKLNDTSNSQCLLKRPRRFPQTLIETLRLQNKKKGEDGNLVEVKEVNGVWRGVCSDNFGITEAAVVCRQLGFKAGASRVLRVPGETGDVVLSSDSCLGTENSLADCKVFGKKSCDRRERVAVDCVREGGKCRETEFLCQSGECIAMSGLCDGQAQCRDGSDEAQELCSSRPQVRLTMPGGSQGLLELRHRGVWGTVCDYNFGQGEADVFCHMLGFDRAEQGGWSSGEVEVTREGSWPVWISFGNEKSSGCTGREQSLEECHNKTYWNDDGACRHEEDVFLRCENDKTMAQKRNADPVTRQVVEKCGLWRRLPEVSGAQQRVTGGRSAEHGTLPWQASIRLQGPGGKSYHHCGAVLISPFQVITTAHCLWSYRDNLEIYYVRVGDNSLEIPDPEEQEFAIARVDFHDYFNVGPYLNNDIAVVHIDKVKHSGGIKFGDKVIPACLPQSSADYSSGINLTVSGWGKNSFDQTGNSGPNSVSRLHMVTVPIIDSEVCRSENVYGEEKITNGMFCAGRLEGGVDSCQGDSGGPAVGFLTLPDAGEVRATVLGLTSWGYGCGRANKPGVYTKLSKYVDWVYERIKQ